jgi:glycosyltransferase involved in cell wall biosynthesis
MRDLTREISLHAPIFGTGGDKSLSDIATDTITTVDSTAAAGRRVAIYRTQILPLSETFVRDQALALRRWRAVLVGEREIKALPIDGLAVRTAFSGPATFGQRAAGLMSRRLGLAPPRMTGVMRHVAPSLIHAHFGFDGVEAWPIARRLGLPLLVTLHGSDITIRMEWFAQGRAGRRWQGYPARLARMAREETVTFIAISENIRQAAIAAGLPDSRIVVLPIGIDPSRFPPGGVPVAERRPTILFLGRLVEKKGGAYLLEAFERVRAQLPEAELVIGGDGPERAKLAERATAIGGVRFVGAFTRELATTLLAEARVFCLPSITAESGDAEGLPLVILEAQASGVPVVTSARGGATEGIEDGVTGYAFGERDVAGLAERLMALLTDDTLAARFSAAAPPFIAERHDLYRQTAQLEALYDRVAGAKA